jgi:hypothetical protein
MSAEAKMITSVGLSGEEKEWLHFVAYLRGYQGWAYGPGRNAVLLDLLHEAMKRLPIETVMERVAQSTRGIAA